MTMCVCLPCLWCACCGSRALLRRRGPTFAELRLGSYALLSALGHRPWAASLARCDPPAVHCAPPTVPRCTYHCAVLFCGSLALSALDRAAVRWQASAAYCGHAAGCWVRAKGVSLAEGVSLARASTTRWRRLAATPDALCAGVQPRRAAGLALRRRQRGRRGALHLAPRRCGFACPGAATSPPPAPPGHRHASSTKASMRAQGARAAADASAVGGSAVAPAAERLAMAVRAGPFGTGVSAGAGGVPQVATL